MILITVVACLLIPRPPKPPHGPHRPPRAWARPAASTAPRTLLGQRGEVLIVHHDQVYRLRVTSLGKLILTK
jgi:hemin uptake protein HemP